MHTVAVNYRFYSRIPSATSSTKAGLGLTSGTLSIFFGSTSKSDTLEIISTRVASMYFPVAKIHLDINPLRSTVTGTSRVIASEAEVVS